MTNSKLIAGLIGPTLIAIALSEALNFHIWASNIPPITYLNGMILFFAGLSIVRFHNLWTVGWSVMVTLVGWIALLGGLFRMFAPEAQQLTQKNIAFVVLIILFLIGVFLTSKAYGQEES
ncbi:MAG: hypothetical protein AAGF83_03110 [Cyanobacteria bacterium P01_G01_bin.67]